MKDMKRMVGCTVLMLAIFTIMAQSADAQGEPAGDVQGDELAAADVTAGDVQAELDREMNRTQPDYVVYRPGSLDGSTFDTGNEHFLAFDGPDGSLMAVWTQSSYENAGNHRIVFARSEDEGVTWTAPKHLVGPRRPGEEAIASWGFPLVSRSGRIYVLYNQSQGVTDVAPAMTGTMDAIYSDDMGRTWSEPKTVPLPRSPYDHPDAAIPPNWIVWQMPMRDRGGRYIAGFTRWVSEPVRTRPHSGCWTAWESLVQFMRFENIDDDPAPTDIRVTILAAGNDALRVPHYTNPMLSVAQEPSLVYLPDGRLFCTMRTMSGFIWYSVSDDDGQTWLNPRPLLRRDHGSPILQPLCCCPIYEYERGRYVLLHHNNDGRLEGFQPEDTCHNRRPAFIALGEFRPDADQPIWFSESKQLMDIDNVPLGPGRRRDVAAYTSATRRQGNFVLWYPDRKFFLLGRRITDSWLSDLEVPAP